MWHGFYDPVSPRGPSKTRTTKHETGTEKHKSKEMIGTLYVSLQEVLIFYKYVSSQNQSALPPSEYKKLFLCEEDTEIQADLVLQKDLFSKNIEIS